MRRIGLFGGTFDPPHVGHLALAEWARTRLGLERVVFMPAGIPPHKLRRGLSPVRHRVAMTRLAVRGNHAFTVSTLEARRAGPSFTVDTLAAIARLHPGSRLYLLMGADSLDDFSTWHEPKRILELATLVVARRKGAGAAARPGARASGSGRLPGKVLWLDNPPLEVSSSALRAELRAHRSVRYLVAEAVERYSTRHRLYRRKA
jgi:nicotinate-nucleotide adenylyltransferase